MGDGRGDGVVTLMNVIDLEEDSLPHTPISCKGRNKRDAISVEEYTEDKQLHKTMMVSPSSETKGFIIDLSNDDEDVQVINQPLRKKPFTYPSITEKGECSKSQEFTFTEIEQSSEPQESTFTEIGQSSKSQKSIFIEIGQSLKPQESTFLCGICVDPKPLNESFKIKGCTHSYCSDCMAMHVASNLRDSVLLIRCPETKCSGVLEVEFCRTILPKEVFERWGNVLCESSIMGASNFNCPFKDCSGPLFDDGGVEVTQSVCPHCSRMFCAQCKVPWHDKVNCQDFQKLGEDEREREDIMLMKLAKDQNWQRCPKCKFYVENSAGCVLISCRCGHIFCYSCGASTMRASGCFKWCKERRTRIPTEGYSFARAMNSFFSF